jgi:hypothetical protein
VAWAPKCGGAGHDEETVDRGGGGGEISDKVVAKMRDRGVISEDAAATFEQSQTGATVDLRKSAGDTAELAQN